METRTTKGLIQKAGGTAGSESVKNRVGIPAAWAKDMALTKEAPEVEMIYRDGEVVLRKKKSVIDFCQQAAQMGRQIKRYQYYNGEEPCTTIYADFISREIMIENHTDELIHRAFGRKDAPSWDDFLAFLEERCVPKTRCGLQYILEAAGLDEYDPVRLVEVSGGRMAEDHQWLAVSEV